MQKKGGMGRICPSPFFLHFLRVKLMLNATLSDVIHLSTLHEAWQKVRDNQGVGGVDHVSIEDFELSLQHNLDTLKNEVEYDTYHPLPLLRVNIEKKDSSKRPLSIPTIRDRVLQTAITIVLTPIFEEEFEDVSFAYRRGRSVNQAISLIERLRDKGYKWVVDADIHRYFDQVDHDLLMREVEKLVTDKGILRLIQQWLKATVVDGNKRYKLTKGIPQGSPLSPLLANLFLDQLDDTLLVLYLDYIDGYRAIQSVQDKAWVAGNGYSLGKTHNAVLDALGCSLRASQKAVIHVVALFVKGVTIPCKVRLVANRFLTRCNRQYNLDRVLFKTCGWCAMRMIL